MSKTAVDHYGNVYFCITDRFTLRQHNEDDTHYLTEEGAGLMRSCLRQGIILSQWMAHPYGDDFGSSSFKDF